MKRHLTLVAACAIALGAAAQATDIPMGLDGAQPDVLIIGEVHDNPQHHDMQRALIDAVAPTAVVYEMLTPAEGATLTATPRTATAQRAASAGFHWSGLDAYIPLFVASPVIVGAALPRADMRAAFSQGAASVFGGDAPLYGLDDPLPAQEQSKREALQFEAHCAAMPMEMMSGMVAAQRLRDAHFARTVLDALDRYGAPVVLITGNGHARTDWGVPVYIAAARPAITVKSIGQGEGGAAPSGQFDLTHINAMRPDRPDPCAVFRSGN